MLLWLDCSSLLSFEVVPGDGGRVGVWMGRHLVIVSAVTITGIQYTGLKKFQSDVTEEVFIFMWG